MTPPSPRLPHPGLLLACAVALVLTACRAGGAGDVDAREAARIASRVADWPRAARLWHELWMRSGYVDSEAAREAARAIAANGDRAGAKGLLRSQVARFGGDAPLLTELGALQLADGEAAPARASFEAALALDPSDTRAATGLAQLYRQSGEDERAIATVRSATRLAAGVPDAKSLGDSATPETWLELARASLNLGELDEACAAFRVAYASLTPEPKDALRLARALLASEDAPPALLDDAQAWLQAAQSQQPNDSRLHRVSASLLLARGAPLDAKLPARRAVELDPGDVDAIIVLVSVLQASGDPAGAAQILEHGLALPLVGDERGRLEALRAPPDAP
ncbi:MAG: tetratricopeptide repeat protein [Planctomycetota bacterium]